MLKQPGHAAELVDDGESFVGAQRRRSLSGEVLELDPRRSFLIGGFGDPRRDGGRICTAIERGSVLGELPASVGE